jgi:hypothetical protein
MTADLPPVVPDPNPEFSEWVASLPATHWAKLDLSACRFGWEAALARRGLEAGEDEAAQADSGAPWMTLDDIDRIQARIEAGNLDLRDVGRMLDGKYDQDLPARLIALARRGLEAGDAAPALPAREVTEAQIADSRRIAVAVLRRVYVPTGPEIAEVRDALGRLVREAWVKWALTQPDPKPSWLVPYDQLNEADKEADRQIGEAVARILSALTAATAAPEVPNAAEETKL